MNTKLKRIICFLLVLSLMFSMTGCSAETTNHFRMVFGCLAIEAYAIIVDKITFPFIEYTGWCVCESAANMFNGLMERIGSDDYRLAEDLGLHDMHLEKLAEINASKEDSNNGEVGGLPNTGETSQQKSLTRKISSLLCLHKNIRYHDDTITVSCNCGNFTEDVESFEDFQEYVPRKRLLFWSDEKQYQYALQEFNCYRAAQMDIDPALLTFLQSLDESALTQENSNKLSEIAGFLASATELISTGAEVDDGFAKGSGIATDFFENVDTYFGYANTLFVSLQIGIDIQTADKYLQTPGKETEAVHATINVLKSATSVIPIAGVAFDKVLDVVEAGIHTVQENQRYNLVAQTARDATVYKTAFSGVYNYWYVEQKDDWDNGPSIADIAKVKLSKEELYGLAPYIEYRVDYEIQQMYGVTVKELMRIYKNSK